MKSDTKFDANTPKRAEIIFMTEPKNGAIKAIALLDSISMSFRKKVVLDLVNETVEEIKISLEDDEVFLAFPLLAEEMERECLFLKGKLSNLEENFLAGCRNLKERMPLEEARLAILASNKIVMEMRIIERGRETILIQGEEDDD